MNFFKKIGHEFDKHVSQKIDKEAEKLGKNIGEFLNEATGTAPSARQQYEYNAQLQKDAQDFNAQEAQKARDWETEMSNTARQRGTADLQQAGLNPILSAGEGAWAGAGATATSPGGSTGAGVAGANPISMITELINASNNTARTKADIDNQTKLTDAEVEKMAVETLNAGTKTTQMVNDEKFAKTWWGRNISPALRDIFGGGGGAVATGATAGLAASKASSARKAAKRPITNVHYH